MNGEVVERWLPVPGWEGSYEVSDQGRVKTTTRRWMRKEKFLRPQRTARGYLMMDLSLDGKTKHMLLHRMVMFAFVGVRPSDVQVNHINGNPLDNRLVNLEFVSAKENKRHAMEVLGKLPRPRMFYGEESVQAKLTTEAVLEIRRLYQEGEGMRSLGRQFGVTHPTIRKIVLNQTWKFPEEQAA